MSDYLWTDTEWTFKIIDRVYKEVEKIAVEELGLGDIYPNQIEIITSEQMLDAYSSIGLPIYYHHWSFGKHFTRDWEMYKQGIQGLAYEIVINSNPCISYLMEENTATMQSLVMAHACVAGDTEYLTPDGWRRIDQYTGGLVGQYEESGQVTFVQPTAYIRRPQTDFIHVVSEKIDQAITDDHVVVFINGNDSMVKITGAELEQRQKDKTRGFNGKFITGFHIEHNTELPLTDDEICLHIAIKADGHIINPDVDKTHFNAKLGYTIQFHLKKERKIERLKRLLQKLDISYAEKPTYDGRWLISIRYSLINKRFTDEWYTASPRQLRLIGEEVCYWDGSSTSNNDKYSSAFQQDVDFVQFAWAATGNRAHLGEGVRCFDVVKSERILVSLSKHGGDDSRLPPEPFHRIPSEDGFAYCFTVPSHMFVTRRHNKISITGNCIGHNWFFKNNALFREWTDAESIIDYLVFAKDYITKCEVREGRDKVENFLDSCHALMSYGVNRYKRPSKLSTVKERKRAEMRENYRQSQVNELFDTLVKEAKIDPEKEKIFPPEPEENILYFCEKYAPELSDWKREIIRIVRKMSQYFYPQSQTKTLNEGTATFVHYRIMNRLHEKGMMTDGSYLEFITSHTNVVSQPVYNSRAYSGINPYALGFAMMQDISRICKDPTDEDRRWFPDIAGSGDDMAVLRDAWVNYRDESFIRQFLSPKVIRDFSLFRVTDVKSHPTYEVTAIHDDAGYEKVRETMADNYERHASVPQIEVLSVNPHTRVLNLQYRAYRDRILFKPEPMVQHVEALWGKTVYLYDSSGKLIG